MTIEVRTIRQDETAGWLYSVSTAFLDPFDPVRFADEVRQLWDYERMWAALEGETIVGTLQGWATELTIPGGARLPGTAIAAVTVRGTHRRRGILRSLMTAEHGAARDRGEAVALLYTSEAPIYGRFGYGPAVPTATWTLDSSATGFHTAATGSMEFAPLTQDTRDIVKRVFESWRVRQPGEIRRREFTWDLDLGLRDSVLGPRWKGYVVLHRDGAGAVDGFVRYKAEEKWVDRQGRHILHVRDMHALTDDAYVSLWRFLAEMDTVTTVRVERRRPAERLPWLLTNARAAVPSDIGDGMWLKLLDVPGALAGRAYDREGSVVLDVVENARRDDEANVRVLLDASPAGATCVRTDRSADLTLDASSLSAAYLGGARLRDAVLAPGVDEHRPGALATADALLRTPEPPWCSTYF